ncbi:hypothetical protein SELMODRAFT_451480 [Selaginella moellendorffii]|uniref:SPX domain-containing protein n=1 Tax=Selaginella moellendorffii TaxID=88036 RepID=D8S9F7_SELML|nr:hypothetical protein SELMODRAFT_451480 [Selaginella moellendorffii]
MKVIGIDKPLKSFWDSGARHLWQFGLVNSNMAYVGVSSLLRLPKTSSCTSSLYEAFLHQLVIVSNLNDSGWEQELNKGCVGRDFQVSSIPGTNRTTTSQSQLQAEEGRGSSGCGDTVEEIDQLDVRLKAPTRLEKANETFCMWVDKLRATKVGDVTWVVKFDKWQRTDEELNYRLTTAVFQCKDDMPYASVLRIHETWLDGYAGRPLVLIKTRQRPVWSPYCDDPWSRSTYNALKRSQNRVTSGSKARIRHTRVGTTGTKLISSNGEQSFDEQQMEGEKARRVGLHVVNKTMRINVKNSQTVWLRQQSGLRRNKTFHKRDFQKEPMDRLLLLSSCTLLRQFHSGKRMVKFQKQLVPEWRVKYCDYKQLKKAVKRIKNQILHTKNQQHKVFDPNVFLVDKSKLQNLLQNPSAILSSCCKQSISSETSMVVHKTRIGDGEDFYETELFGTRSDHEKSFFFGLDDQLNKVDKFLRCKEDEYDAQAQQLHIQMEELVAMQELEGEPGNKGKVQRAAKMLQTAFVEFYRGLRLLRNFSSLNMMAFVKILKKYDKVTGQNASGSYLKMVENSHFATLDKVVKFMDRVERVFTLHFTKGNRKQAMAYLRHIHSASNHGNINFILGKSRISISFIRIFVIN